MSVLGPLVAYLQTPRSASGRLESATLATLATNALTGGASALAVLGSVGGAAYMPRSMRKRVISTVAQAAMDTGRPTQIIAGVGALTTAEVVLNLHEAHQAGATGALLQPMSYQPLLTHEVIGLYQEVAEQTPLPLWVYNNPTTTRHRFSITELANIAQLPNVVGFKDRAASSHEITHRIEEITQRIGPERASRLDWGFSGEDKGAYILGSGATTWHSALAGVLPEICAELANHAVRGRTDTRAARHALDIQRALTPLTVVMGQYGGIRVAHTIAHLRGIEVGELPSPLQELPRAAQGLVRLALASIERSLAALATQSEQASQEAKVPEDGRTSRDDAAPLLGRRMQPETAANYPSAAYMETQTDTRGRRAKASHRAHIDVVQPNPGEVHNYTPRRAHGTA